MQLGRAFGVNLIAAQIGTLASPLVASLLLSSLGWRAMLLLFSLVGVVVGSAFLLVSEPKRSEKFSGAASFFSLFKEARKMLGNRALLGVLVIEMVMAFRIGSRDFLPTYFTQDLSLTPFMTAILYTVFLLSGLPAPYFWGSLSDKFERRKVLMLATGVACVLWFILPHSGSGFHLLLVLVPLGFAGQGIGGVIHAFVADASNQKSLDLVFGIYFTLAFTLGSISPVILGYLADTFGFYASFSYVAIISFFGVVAAYCVK
jgi:MFS family permease